MSAGDLGAAWKTMRGPIGSAAWKGAAIGAGLNAGASLISDATNGDFNGRSVGRAMGAGLRGGALGGLGGAAYGAGNFFLGAPSRRVMTANARGLAMRTRNMSHPSIQGRPMPPRTVIGRGNMMGGVNLMNRTAGRVGTSARRVARQPMTGGGVIGSGRMGMRGMGGWAGRNLPTFSRMGMTARNFGRDVRQMF